MSTNRGQTFRIDLSELPREAVIFGCTPAMLEIREKIERVRAVDLPVLILGESGTGKEIIARYLHTRSNRCDAPFVKLNCAAIPASLLESELWGYEKGSFTGANEVHTGLVEIAEGGTLFLDEIGDMHWDLQGKLLQLLQDGTYTRIGGSEERHGNTRVICATNVELKKAVDDGVFREDLYYRIEGVSLRLPTLRDRKSDIPQLCGYFLEKLARQFSRPAPQLSPAILNLLKEWNWPGNLRELQNWIARAVILGEEVSLAAELRHQITANCVSDNRALQINPLKEASRRAAAAVTGTLILKVLEANGWNRRRTAEKLNMSYRSLLYKLREVGIPQRRRSHRGGPPTH